MKLFFKNNLLSTLFLIAISFSVSAQLPEPNADGVTTGHTHFNVPDAAKHLEIWKLLGGEVSGSLIAFPGMYIVLTEAEPSGPSIATTANHIGFSVQSFDLYKAKLAAVGAEVFYENAETGQMLVDLPDGVRIEIQQVEGLDQPIVFHHLHLSALDLEGLRDWYVEVFGAEVGERRGLPSAIIPGGRVDFIGARGDAPLPSRGAAIDHIGFDVADMDVFAEKMNALGIEFDVEPQYIESIGITIAFITDPAGTFIEITQGLADL